MRLLKIRHGSCRRVDDPNAFRTAEFKCRQFHAPPGSESENAFLSLERFRSSACKVPFRDILAAGGFRGNGQEFLTMRSIHVNKECFFALIDLKEGQAIPFGCWH